MGDAVSPVVVGIDTGPGSAAVLRAAARAAASLDAELLVVHVVGPSAFAGVHPDASLIPDAEALEVAVFPDVVEALADLPVPWRLTTMIGDPVTCLAGLAGSVRASVVVVGSHTPGAMGRLRALLGGSVPARLLRCQSTPVYVVPCHGEDTLSGDGGDLIPHNSTVAMPEGGGDAVPGEG